MDSARLLRAVTQWKCRQHLNRISLLTDRRDWEGLAMCYSEQAILSRPSDPHNPIVGRDGSIELKHGVY